MPASTEEIMETSAGSRATASRAKREIETAERAGGEAVRELVSAWSDALRLFVPPVLLQPEAAVRIVATAIEELFELQRRFAEELLSVSADAVNATDPELFMHRRTRNGTSRSVA